jgi:hypothetical protein
MAATPITPYAINRLGGGLDLSTVTPTATDATNGNSIANSGNMFLDVHNTDTVSRALTFTIIGATDGNPVTPLAVPIAASKTQRLGPFPTGIYGGTLNFTTASALLTVAACTMPTT